MANAQVDISSDSTQMLKALKAIETGFDKLGDKLTEAERKSKEAATAGEKAWSGVEKHISGVGKAVTTMVTGFITAQGALAAFGLEFDKLKNKATAAGDFNKQFSANLTAAKRNAPEGVSIEDIKAATMRVSQKTGISPLMVSDSFAGMMAAGSLSIPQYESIIEAGSPVAFDAPEDFKSLGPGVVAMMKANPGMSAQQAVGLIASMGGGSRVDRGAAYIPAATKVMGAAGVAGLDPIQMTALFNATTRGTADPTGDQSVTAMGGLAAQLAAYRDKNLPGSNDVKAIMDRIKSDPKARAEFVKGVKGEGVTKLFLQGLFKDGSDPAKELANQFATLPNLAGAQGAYDSLTTGLNDSPNVRAARASQVMTTTSELMKLNQRNVDIGSYRDGYEALQKQLSTSGLADKVDLMSFDALTQAGISDPREYVNSRVNDTITRLGNPIQAARRGGRGGVSEGLGHVPGYGETSADNRETIELLRAMLHLMQDTNEQSKKTTFNVAPNGDRPAVPGGPATSTTTDLPHAKPGAY